MTDPRTTPIFTKPIRSQSSGLTPKQQEIVDKVRSLRQLTRESGFKTTRSQGELLATLGANDLAAVAAALEGK